MNRVLPPLIVLLFAASSARADMGPFFPAQVYAKTVNRIEITEEQPDYVFVLHRFNGPGHSEITHESTFVELKPGQPLEITGYRRDTAELFIVPREVAKAYSSAEELVGAIQSKQIAVASYSFRMEETVPVWSSGEITATYRVQPASSGGLEIVRTSGDPLRQWYIVALLVPLAILLSGIWLIRRFMRRVRAQLTT